MSAFLGLTPSTGTVSGFFSRCSFIHEQFGGRKDQRAVRIVITEQFRLSSHYGWRGQSF